MCPDESGHGPLYARNKLANRKLLFDTWSLETAPTTVYGRNNLQIRCRRLLIRRGRCRCFFDRWSFHGIWQPHRPGGKRQCSHRQSSPRRRCRSRSCSRLCRGCLWQRRVRLSGPRTCRRKWCCLWRRSNGDRVRRTCRL